MDMIYNDNASSNKKKIFFGKKTDKNILLYNLNGIH